MHSSCDCVMKNLDTHQSDRDDELQAAPGERLGRFSIPIPIPLTGRAGERCFASSRRWRDAGEEARFSAEEKDAS